MECDFQCTGAANEVVEKERGNVQQQVNIFHFFNKPRVREKYFLAKAVCISHQNAGEEISGLCSMNGFHGMVFIGVSVGK